jgi:putative spermidine/putrescine transport system substrate-binding protein
VLDPGPRITAIEAGLFEKFDGKKLSNAAKVPTAFIDEWGICVGAQVVGIAYNPKKLPAPKGWKDLFVEPWVSRLGLTGFQTTFGTVSMIEIAKVFGGSETNVDPAFVELKKILPKVAAVAQPAAMPGLLQQGQCDITYINTQTVATLKGKGVDIDFVKPDTGAVAFYTTLHIAKGASEIDNAYKYFDTVVDNDVQAALTKPPYNFLPANKEVPIPPDLPMKSLDEMSTFIRHDWAKINPLRAAWIEKFNKEMAK